PLVIAPGGGTATIQIQVDPAGLIPGADIVDTFLEVDSNSTVDQPSVSIPIEGYLRDPWIDTVETVTLDPVLSSAGVQNFTVDVTNLGTSDLTVDDASFFGSESFTVLDDLIANPLVLAAGETGQVNLSFDPTGLSGTVNAILDLFADDPITAGASIAYTVNVVRDPVIQYDTTLSFVFNGLEPQSIEIPIDNAGTVSSLEISGANFIIGGDEANFVLTGNLPTIPAGEFANLTFDFTPTAERYGTYSAVLEVVSNDPVDAAARILINVTMLPTSPAPFSPASVDDAAGNSFANAAYAATNLIGGDFVASLGDAPAGSNNWVSDTSPADYFEAGVQPVLVFDLGADVDVRLLYLWAYSEGTTFTGDRQGNSLRSFSLRFATDADTTEGFGTTIAINPSFTMAPGLVTTEGVEFGTPQAQPVQAYDLGSTVKARYVEMTLADNYFGLPQHDGGDRVGFNEIAFDSLAQPPSGSPFDTWMAEFTELSGDDLLPTADPDGDGSSNLTEFAFDGDPTDSNNNGKISLVIADGSDTPDLSDELILTMAMRAGAAFADSGSPLISDAIDGLIYQVEGSTDLA
ncbi:MAG: choice-of-anchor D domain-containing protein, partial [Luteolibacter sp.]